MLFAFRVDVRVNAAPSIAIRSSATENVRNRLLTRSKRLPSKRGVRMPAPLPPIVEHGEDLGALRVREAFVIAVA